MPPHSENEAHHQTSISSISSSSISSSSRSSITTTTTTTTKNNNNVNQQGSRRHGCQKNQVSLLSFFVSLLFLWLCTLEVVEGLLPASSVSIVCCKSSARPCPSFQCSDKDDENDDDDDDKDKDSDNNSSIQPPPATEPAEEPEPERPEFIPNYTGLDKQFNWDLANRPVPIQSELALLKSGVLWRPGEFNRIDGPRVTEVEDKCGELGMTLAQGFLIRKQLAVTKAMRNSWKLTEQLDTIERKWYCTQGRTLLQLSEELDLPPVSILRAILRKRVDEAFPDMLFRDRKNIVKSIIKEDDECSELVDNFLSAWEIEQLQAAKRFDVIGYSEVATEIESSKWEQAIYTFLDERKINYLSEDDMRSAGSRITPDCLLLDNCVINGRTVRWIDAKNFYGSGLRESSGIMKKMEKQIAKYDAEFGGSGAIVFKHGFSQKFIRTLPSTLFLDAGPLLIL